MMATAATTSTASTTVSKKKRIILWSLLSGALVIGAVLAGVLGSQAANKKRRPLPIEKVTYTMVTEGLAPALVMPVPANSVMLQQQNITTPAAGAGATTTTTTATTEGTFNSDTGATGNTIFGTFYENTKKFVGISTPAPIFDPSKMVVPEGAVAVPSWKAAGNAVAGNGRVLCYPKSGKEVLEMASGEFNSPCDVLILTNDRWTPYAIDHTINITKPKLFIGNPLMMPMLNSTKKIVRLFDVYPGGRLETRSVTLVRGFGRLAGPFNEMNIVSGSIVRVQVGGYFTATGTMFRERNNTLTSFIEEVEKFVAQPMTRSRQFGQLILVLGGRLHLNGCRSMRFRPFGNGILNAMVIGRDINMVAGMATLVAHFTYASNLYSTNFFISGAIALVMGGALTMVGGNTINSNLMQLQIGWSCQLGGYAGAVNTIGWQYTSTNGVLFRENGGQFATITGSYYKTGFVQGRAWGVAVVFGPGQTYANAAGVYNWHGGATCSYAISTAFFGVGASNYIGSGQAVFNGIPQVRTSVTSSSSGAGFYSFNGAGSLTQMLLPAYGVNMIRFNAGVGTDFFVGAGWANNINCTRFSLQLVNNFWGFGNQAFVGFGGAVFVRSYSNSRRLVNYAWPTTFTYTIAGTGIRSSGTKGQTIVVTKGGVTRYIYNKTTKSVTQISSPKIQKTASPTSLGGGKFRRRKASTTTLAGLRRKVQAEDVVNHPAGMASWLQTIVDTTGGLDPSIDKKAVLLQTTIREGRTNSFDPPHPDLFKAAELKTRWGGYAKILGDGLVDSEEAVRKLQANGDHSAGYHPGMVSVNNSACFMCNVGPGRTQDHIAGPGTCEVADGCESNDPVTTYKQASALTTQDILPPGAYKVLPELKKNGDVELPDTWMLWSELTVFCHSRDPAVNDASITEDCLTKDYIKDVIKTFLLLNTTTPDSYSISVGQSGVHRAAQLPNFSNDDASMDDLKMAVAPHWNPDCQGWTKYDIQITSTDPATEQHILDVFEEFFADPSDLSDTIVANWEPTDDTDDAEPCGVAIIEKAEQRMPSIKTMPSFKPSENGGLMGPNVAVSDGESIVPATKLEAGKPYTIFVQNFPKGIAVNVKMLGAGKLDGPVVGSIASFDDDGTSEIAWTPTQEQMDSLKGGKFYLQAQPKDFPALFGFSNVLQAKSLKPAPLNPWMFDLKNL